MQNKNLLIIVLGVLIILFVVALAFISTRGTREPSVVPQVGEFTLDTETLQSVEGDVFAVEVSFRTGTDGVVLPISTVSFRLTYDFEGATADIQVVDAEGMPTENIFPGMSLLNEGDWTFPVKSVVTENGQVVIDFAGADTTVDGYLSADFVTLATIYFKGVDIPEVQAFELSFDPAHTKMMTKELPVVNILSVPANLQYTILPQ